MVADKPTIIPTVRYHDAVAALDWLCHAFGFKRHVVVEGENDTIKHAQLVLGNGMVMIGSLVDDSGRKIEKLPGESDGTATGSIYVVVTDADAHFVHARAAGARIIDGPEDQHYGGRLYSCSDPEGNLWNFGTYNPWNETP